MIRTKKEAVIIFIIIIVDFLLVYLAHLTGWWARFVYNIFSIHYPEFIPQKAYTDVIIYIGILWVFILTFFDYYKEFPLNTILDDFFVLLKAASWGTFLNAALSFVWRDYSYSRLAMVYTWFISIFFLLFWRFLLRIFWKIWMKSGISIRKVVLIGGKEDVENFSKKVIGITEIRIIDTIIDEDKDITDRVVSIAVPEVIVIYPLEKWKKIKRIIELCVPLGIRVKVISDLFEISSSKIATSIISGVPVIEFGHGLLVQWNRILKRLFDIVVVILFSPGLIFFGLMLSIAIKMDSYGDILFKQKRTGKGGREFEMLKFRSMQKDAQILRDALELQSQTSGPIFKIKDDPRLTRVGRILRRFYLDEIPQFLNVLKGEMSLVGPRPLPIYEAEKLDKEVKRRVVVPPGITGLWQVTPEVRFSSEEMFKLDYYYIENWSLLMDCKTLLKTIYIVLRGTGV